MHFLKITLTNIFLIALFLTYPVYSFIQAGNVIKDLQFTGTLLDDEMTEWSPSGSNPAAQSSECDGAWFLGGYNIFYPSSGYHRLYTGLPPHTVAHFTVAIYLVDNWLHTDAFELAIGGTNLRIEGPKKDNVKLPNCGASNRADVGFLEV
mmetsp:Transcript_41527/g.36878  ORF Transcript_41527/g.36878 Transcript_41527/m.36878 type:complete len:150 (+) Transcript_41527:51-500(+)